VRWVDPVVLIVLCGGVNGRPLAGILVALHFYQPVSLSKAGKEINCIVGIRR
jgi:hypothetical protein